MKYIAVLWYAVITASRAQIEEYNLETRKDLIYQVKDITM